MIGARAEHDDRLPDQRRADEPHQLRQLRDRRDRWRRTVLVLPRLRDVVRDPLPVAEDAPTDGDGEQPRVEHVWVRERDPVDVVRPRGDDREHDRGATGLAERDHGPAPFAEGGEPAGSLVHPLGPVPGPQVLDVGPVARQANALDGEAVRGEPFPDRAHRGGRAGEAVDHEDADRPPPSENGSQPGRICGLLTRSEGSLATSGVHEQREDHVEERDRPPRSGRPTRARRTTRAVPTPRARRHATRQAGTRISARTHETPTPRYCAGLGQVDDPLEPPVRAAVVHEDDRAASS